MRRAGSLLLMVLAASYVAESVALAVYALSFWHYLLYWWAYRYGAVSPRRFRREALLMKSMAMLALAAVVLTLPWHFGAAIVMAAGFLLNTAAAHALGVARTYYGWEIGDVPHAQVRAFPYSVVPHPMLVGNIVGHAGALLSPEFRAGWWPLAAGHIVLNLGLLLMETTVTPGRARLLDARGSRPPSPVRAALPGRAFVFMLAAMSGAATGLAAAAAAGWRAGLGPCAVVGASAAVHTLLSAADYVSPGEATRFRHPSPASEVP